ncbi:unnamed protein product, partial [Rotaria sp. Silwood1]
TKCTCFHRRTRQSKSTLISQQEQTSNPTNSIPSSSMNESITRVNRHSSLMQTATLSAYHTSEPQRSPIKSCSLLNNKENHDDIKDDTYEFVGFDVCSCCDINVDFDCRVRR